MASSKNDYEFVTGDDLDKIKFYGVTTPQKSGPLYGELIVYLLEAVQQRKGRNWLAATYYDDYAYDSMTGGVINVAGKWNAIGISETSEFTASISAAQMSGIWSGISTICKNYAHTHDDFAACLSASYRAGTSYSSREERFKADFNVKPADPTKLPFWNNNAFKSGAKIDYWPVLRLYNSFKLLTVRYLGEYGVQNAYGVLNAAGKIVAPDKVCCFSLKGSSNIKAGAFDMTDRTNGGSLRVYQERGLSGTSDDGKAEFATGSAEWVYRYDFTLCGFKTRHVKRLYGVVACSLYACDYDGASGGVSSILYLPFSVDAYGGEAVIMAGSVKNNALTDTGIAKTFATRLGWSGAFDPTSGGNKSQIVEIRLAADKVYVFAEWDSHTTPS